MKNLAEIINLLKCTKEIMNMLTNTNIADIAEEVRMITRVVEKDIVQGIEKAEAGSLSEIIGKLESKGLLERNKDEHDRRRMKVQLTESGEKHASESMKEDCQEDDIFQILNQEEQQKLKKILEKLLSQWREERGQTGRRGAHAQHGHGGRHGSPHELAK